jgi:hypothetical protein
MREAGRGADTTQSKGLIDRSADPDDQYIRNDDRIAASPAISAVPDNWERIGGNAG